MLSQNIKNCVYIYLNLQRQGGCESVIRDGSTKGHKIFSTEKQKISGNNDYMAVISRGNPVSTCMGNVLTWIVLPF